MAMTNTNTSAFATDEATIARIHEPTFRSPPNSTAK